MSTYINNVIVIVIIIIMIIRRYKLNKIVFWYVGLHTAHTTNIYVSSGDVCEYYGDVSGGEHWSSYILFKRYLYRLLVIL